MSPGKLKLYWGSPRWVNRKISNCPGHNVFIGKIRKLNLVQGPTKVQSGCLGWAIHLPDVHTDGCARFQTYRPLTERTVRKSVSGKENLRVAYPKGKLGFKFFSSPVVERNLVIKHSWLSLSPGRSLYPRLGCSMVLGRIKTLQ